MNIEVNEDAISKKVYSIIDFIYKLQATPFITSIRNFVRAHPVWAVIGFTIIFLLLALALREFMSWFCKTDKILDRLKRLENKSK